MRKILVLLFICCMAFSQSAFAEKIALRITPETLISTDTDNIEVGDWIRFKAVNDVYVGDELYIKKGTSVIGFVDFFHPNGWMLDKSEIRMNKFKVKNAKNEVVEIDHVLDIYGDSAWKKDRGHFLDGPVFRFVRGAEINAYPDVAVFNIFINR